MMSYAVAGSCALVLLYFCRSRYLHQHTFREVGWPETSQVGRRLVLR